LKTLRTIHTIEAGATVPRVAIIGGGVAALAAAIDLSGHGFKVVILEKESRPGGKAGRMRFGPYSFDTGPTVLTLPGVLDQLFLDSGASRLDYLELLKLELTCRYRWDDGTTFDAWSEPEKIRAEVERCFPHDTAAFAEHMGHLARLYQASADSFLFRPFSITRAVSSPDARRSVRLWDLLLRRTISGSVRSRFRSEKLAQVFERFATYNGSDPFRAPSILNVIAHVELATGTWYPRGGMGAVSDALVRRAMELGVEIRTGAEVVSLLIRNGGAVGVVLATGEAVHADSTMSNVDALWTYQNLVFRAGGRVPRRLSRAERSLSGFLILAAVRGHNEVLAHHNVFFVNDYQQEFRSLFADQTMPWPMTVYLSLGARTDCSLAPADGENWYILINAPSLGDRFVETTDADRYQEMVFGRLREFGLDPDILWTSRLTPATFESRDYSVGGALYGTSSNTMSSAFFRPGHRSRSLRNLYLLGGSTHPGGGVPLAIASGRIAARAVAARFLGERD